MTYDKPEIVMLGVPITLIQASKMRKIDPDGVSTPGAVPLELYDPDLKLGLRRSGNINANMPS